MSIPITKNSGPSDSSTRMENMSSLRILMDKDTEHLVSI
jgi:hypothetical protein